ncbi:beta-hexosaminidase subunit beta-like [Culicoides brevitarsis]|uniref:beta-hexosaminidase subunit beta-like n=1 Tax=Culicoides brevitarsis TaxID=469753 RepID=UPI00307C9D92
MKKKGFDVLVYLCLAIVFVAECSAYIVDPGPVVIATSGEIWPKPKKQQTEETFSTFTPTNFHFKATEKTCDILDLAFERYTQILVQILNNGRRNRRSQPRRRSKVRLDPLFSGNLVEFNVKLTTECEDKPYQGMDESYVLTVTNGSASLDAKSVWGVLRGLESFSQLTVYSGEGTSLRVNHTVINDEPRFSWRGLLVDTSRHFINVDVLLKILDGMAYNKLNVFHWHIVDDHSFPYESRRFPELSAQGAFTRRMVYSVNDIENVIEYARIRGIRVLAEFDTPGHTRSWGVSHPELLTECEGQYKGKLGPMNPINEEVYVFLQELFKEVTELFPDKYIHLGGDEVGFECWQSNSNITEYMKQNDIRNYEKLEEIFIQRIIDNVDQLGANSIVWQEVYVNRVSLPQKTAVHIWTGDRFRLLYSVTKDGHPALLSSCWYLDHLSTGGDWRKYYTCDPHDFSGNAEQKDLVLGGEACMWAEVVDNGNILQRIFPRVSAAAEKLWSQQSVKDIEDAARRLEEHYCRLNVRGIPAQPPNGPGFCA